MQKKPRDPDNLGIKLDAQLCFAIYGAAHAFTRTYKPLLDPLGLTYPQYLVMIALWEEDDQPVKAIGDRLGLDSGTLSPLLKRLEQSGLVTRRRDRDDERQVRISLTKKGTELKAQATGVAQAIGKAVGCSLEEAVALRDELIALKQRLTKAGSEETQSSV
ncbi:DNA-binding MarR family transcriptional regulator [Neorhizobium galegae]|uniref:MarR family winged helix-turn-helix transcriptional regulator n=1 Tax=Neorhizobium galegae TaxID=399 RepID=UPI001AEA4C48|nr:MarR family transcriptional regulator [Neorhizobium galegae]MBP2560410.1 DNA-binding MarR family transcriptional regulator [Neorhizobium galegae]MDQ0133182.1 DNA-binding MarR family transcriptional regulator [Neorhizobium galegae]